MDEIEPKHTRSSNPDNGPDFCFECSEAVKEWVEWPCSPAKVVQLARQLAHIYCGENGVCEAPDAACPVSSDQPQCPLCGARDGLYPNGDRPKSDAPLVSGCERCGSCL